MYLRATTKNAMPTMITAMLDAPPVQPWNFSRIMSEFKLFIVAAGAAFAGLEKQL